MGGCSIVERIGYRRSVTYGNTLLVVADPVKNVSAYVSWHDLQAFSSLITLKGMDNLQRVFISSEKYTTPSVLT